MAGYDRQGAAGLRVRQPRTFPGTNVEMPQKEGPRPMQQGPVIAPEVTVESSQPSVEVTKDVAWFEDRRNGARIPRSDISDYRNARGNYARPRATKINGKEVTIGGSRISSKEMYQGEPRLKALYDETVHAEQPLGGYADKADILQPASEKVTVRAEDMPAGGVTKHPVAQEFISEHGSEQQAGYAAAPPSEQEEIRKNPSAYNKRVKNAAGKGRIIRK